MELEKVLIKMFFALESNDLETYVKLRPLAIQIINRIKLDEPIVANVHLKLMDN